VDFFRGPPPYATMCPGVDSAPENEYQEFIPGVKAAGVYG